MALASGAVADEPTTPSAPGSGAEAAEEDLGPREAAAVAVYRAWHAKDTTRLAELAAKEDPDPWLVADDLLAAEATEASLAFARAAPRPDTEALPAYVASHGKRTHDPALRQCRDDVMDAAVRKDLAAGLARIDACTWDHESVPSCQIRGARAMFLEAARRLEEAPVAYRAAAEACRRLGWLRMAATNLRQLARFLRIKKDLAGAVEAARLWVEVETQRGRSGDRVRALLDLAKRLQDVDDHRAAAATAAEAAGAADDEERLSEALGIQGRNLRALHQATEAVAVLERRVGVGRRRADPRGLAEALTDLGAALLDQGQADPAIGPLDEAFTLYQQADDDEGILAVLEQHARLRTALADLPAALVAYDQALAQARSLEDREAEVRILENVAIAHYGMGELRKALDLHREALALAESLGDRERAATIRMNMGATLESLGDPRAKQAALEEALRVFEEIGDAESAALCRANLAATLYTRGEAGRALVEWEQALAVLERVGSLEQAAQMLSNLATVLLALGDTEGALRHLERARALHGKTNSVVGLAKVLRQLGVILVAHGEWEQARSIFAQALEGFTRASDRAHMALALTDLAAWHEHAGDLRESARLYERAHEIHEETGDREALPHTLLGLGRLYGALGRTEEAERALQTARDMGTSQQALESEVGAVQGLAALRLRASRPDEALALVRAVLPRVAGLGAGLSDDHAAHAREDWAELFGIGLEASAAVGDADAFLEVAENSRARALLEGLGGGDALRSATLPPELEQAERTARGDVLEARARLAAAEKQGARAAISAARDSLDAAQQRERLVVQRIQRTARVSADLTFPRPRHLGEVRAALGPDEALVLYGTSEERAFAAVVTKEGARVASLGLTAGLADLVDEATSGREDPGVERAAQALRERLAAPLGLGGRTKRILVSPQGILSVLPFCLLFPDQEVACLPSATTWLALREAEMSEGRGVLALGNPDYRHARAPATVAVVRGSMDLVPLPATEEEVAAIGDVVLLQREATESGLLAAVRGRARWRAIHLACHGLVDADRPLFSALALTPEDGQDGYLTTLEVLRMSLPADLVVLSACETARGRVLDTEGVFGFPRAFMLAGSPRVLCSLWKVDDEATRALMTRFYALWNPRVPGWIPGARKGLPAAEALRQAQVSVRDDPAHPRWRHPRYWAAWALWGLPD